MANGQGLAASSVERLPQSTQSRVVSDELDKLGSLLTDACPRDAMIRFAFDGKLQVHIDVRQREQVTVVETLLPMLGLGLFHSVSRGGTPHHPFFHRVSAVIDR